MSSVLWAFHSLPKSTNALNFECIIFAKYKRKICTFWKHQSWKYWNDNEIHERRKHNGILRCTDYNFDVPIVPSQKRAFARVHCCSIIPFDDELTCMLFPCWHNCIKMLSDPFKWSFLPGEHPDNACMWQDLFSTVICSSGAIWEFHCFNPNVSQIED